MQRVPATEASGRIHTDRDGCRDARSRRSRRPH
ncbi:MAG: hypothetical protein U0361_17625 [Nitrospiraceae bacterium]